MNTTQLTRTNVKEAVADKTWSSVFPPEIKTKEASLVFVKKLLAVSVSSITYLRMFFPETAYKDVWIEGINVRVLMDESSCNGSNILVSWIKGCFDAIEKRYLREMILSIYSDPKDSKSVLEAYTYKFSYTDDGDVILDQFSGDSRNGSRIKQLYEIQKPTMKLIRSILLFMQNLKELPTKTYLKMKIFYYEDITPMEYEPPGFCADPEGGFHYPENSTCYKIGEVSTGFHSIKLRASVQEVSEDETSDRKETNMEVETIIDTSMEDGSRKLKRSNKIRLTPGKAFPATSQIDENEGEPTFSQISSSQQLLSTPLDQRKSFSLTQTPLETPKLTDIVSGPSSVCSIRSVDVDPALTGGAQYPVRCPCGVNSDEGLMILCDVCSYWQHAACFAILEESQAPSKHFCEICADPASLCTDPRLCFVESKEKEKTCLYRRALMIIRDMKGLVSSAVISQRLGVNISQGTNVVRKLVEENILKICSNGISKKVNQDVLFNVAYPKYFNRSVSESASSIEDRRNEDNGMEDKCEVSQKTRSPVGNIGLKFSQDTDTLIDVMNLSSLLSGENSGNFVNKVTNGSERYAGEPSSPLQSASMNNYRSADDVDELQGVTDPPPSTSVEVAPDSVCQEKENRPSSTPSKSKSKLSRKKRKLSSVQESDARIEVDSHPRSDTNEELKQSNKRKKVSGTRGIRV